MMLMPLLLTVTCSLYEPGRTLIWKRTPGERGGAQSTPDWIVVHSPMVTSAETVTLVALLQSTRQDADAGVITGNERALIARNMFSFDAYPGIVLIAARGP